MKRSFSKPTGLVLAGTALIAVTYGLVRLAYGLVLPDAQADLGFGPAAAGWISAAASTLYCVGAVVGFVAASEHPRALVWLAAGTAAVGAAGMASSQGPVWFGAAAVIGSTGAGAASPALVRLVVRNGGGAGAQSIVNAGTGPGLVAAGVLALLVLPEWRVAWFVAAACAAGAGVAVLLADHSTRPEGTERPALPGSSWFRAHRRLLLAALLLGAGSAAVWNDGRAVLVDAGVDRGNSIAAWIALGVGGAAVVVTSRWTRDTAPARLWAVTVMGVVLGSVVLGLAPGVLPTALVACLVFGWGYTAATGALIAWTAEIDRDRAAAGTAVLFVTLVLGQALGAALAGVVIGAAGAWPAFVLAAALALVAVPVAGRGHSSARSAYGRMVP